MTHPLFVRPTILLLACLGLSFGISTAPAASLLRSNVPATPTPGSLPAIVIDHTAVTVFELIPAAYIDLVKNQKMIASYLGGSHARQMHYGLRLLADQDPKYAADIAYDPNSYSNSSALRDLTGKFNAFYSSWSDRGGADTYWLDDAATTIVADTMKEGKSALGYPVSVSIYGWSFHMTNPHYASNELGHAFSDADLQRYVDVLQAFTADPAINETKFIYHTSVTDGSRLEDDTTYNMNRWNEMIRQAAATNGGILFDQADIEHWNTSNTTTFPETDYAGRTVYRRHSDYEEAEFGGPEPDTFTGDHTNDALDLRKAKALWVLMARLAGWTPGIQITWQKLSADGSLLIEFDTLAGQTYYIESSADLRNWSPNLPPISGTGERVQWRSAPGEEQRFYRCVLNL